MKDLIRFEPYYNSYIFSYLGKMYMIEDLSDDNKEECFIVNRKDKTIPYNGLTSPIQVQIQYTNRCNMKCPHCYADSGRNLPDELSDDQLKSLLLRLRDFGVLKIEWSGGEIFTRKNFFRMVNFAEDLGFEQNILTNGYTIGKLYKNTSFLWKLFTGIQISINGFKDNFNKWVGRDTWKFVKGAVEMLYDSKPKDNSLSITTTLDEMNLKDLSLIAQWINKKDILWKIGQPVPNGRSVVNDDQALKLLDLSYCEIMKLRSLYSINVIHQYDKSEQEKDSVLPLEWNTEIGARWFMYIKANGDVYPFPYWDGKDEFKAGNILSDTLENIWYSKAFNFYRSASRDKTNCASCKLICQMWARSFSAFDGDLFKTPRSHPNCPVTFL